MAEGKGSTSGTSGAARQLTKSLSMPCNETLNIRRASSPPPPQPMMTPPPLPKTATRETPNIRQALPPPPVMTPPLLPQTSTLETPNIRLASPPPPMMTPPLLPQTSTLENPNIWQASPPPQPPMPMPPPLLSRTATRNQILNFQNTPPAISISPPRTPSNDLHPITEITREQELGKLVINLAVPVSIALLLTINVGNTEKLLVVHAIAAGLMIGCMAIWNGILFRKEFPRFADFLEKFGISLVLLFLFGLVASFLPGGFSWLIWLSGGLCLLPFMYAHIKRQTPAGHA